MKLSEFIALDQEEKKMIVFKEGVPIAKRQLLDHMVFLFHWEGYYVETYCCHETKKIEEFRIFYHPEHLTAYLDAIPLDNIWN